ncbi:MAG: type II toxin-antitoxin system VapC family toxin [Deltaproteobacteria bacterium]|nr:type II toxin-antitoxin system VapC family toxin [Deltaproteobacteria bacterium]
MSATSTVVVDAWGLLALLRAELPAGAIVRRYLRRAAAGNLRLLLGVVNLGEVFYRVWQTAGEAKAEQALRLIRSYPIEIVPAKEEVAIEAARLKAKHSVPYADAFVVALARLEHASVATGDPDILGLSRALVKVRRLSRDS